MIPPVQGLLQIGGFGVESIQYHLGGTFRGTYYTLNDNIINGRIRGIGRRGGLQQRPHPPQRSPHHQVVKELIKNDVIVLTTGCNGIACAMEGLLTPEAAARSLRPGSGRGLRDRGYPAGPAPGLLRGQQPHPAGGHRSGQGRRPGQGHLRSARGRQRPEWMSEKAISIGHYFVASGVYTVFGLHLPGPAPRCSTTTCPRRWKSSTAASGIWKPIPSSMPSMMIAHIDKKRKELGIDKARERVLMDMADRQALEG
jgi:carbon-monoxide dehydrogenase catalytic subunit